MTPAAWQADSADNIAAATRWAVGTTTGPSISTSSASDRPGTYCITVHGTPSSTTTSCTVTMWGGRAAARRGGLQSGTLDHLGSHPGGVPWRDSHLLDGHLDTQHGVLRRP